MTPDLWNLVATYSARVVGALFLLVASVFVSRWVASLVRRSCERARIDETLIAFLARVVRWVVLIIAGLMCLSIFGIQTTSFAAVLGAAGLAIGLALQGTLSNFAAGVMLLVFRPFKVGDLIVVAGRTGKVAEIDIFFTLLDTVDNRRLIIPNGQVFGAVIENVTFHPVRRADIPVGTPYDVDVDAARAVLEAAADATPGRDTSRPTQVVFVGLGASSIDWEVRVWSPTPDFNVVAQAVRRSVRQGLHAAAIEIPFPQLDVHTDPASAAAA